MVSYKIGKNEADQRFDKFLKKVLKEAPDSFIYKMLRKKNITLNGKKADGKEKLAVGDEIKIFLAEDTFLKFSGDQENKDNKEYENAYQRLMEIPIVFENEHILVANKPAGVLSQKSKEDDISVNEWLIGYLLNTKQISKESLYTFKPSIVNRLDRNTSGMIICGKTLAGSQYMSRIIKDKSLQKYYRCLVPGIYHVQDRIQGYLYKDEKANKVTIYQTKTLIPKDKLKDSVLIDTYYEDIQCGSKITLMQVQIFTGKTHQIRSHLSFVGHPLIGDQKYGDARINEEYKKYGVKNQLLHSYQLIFPENNDDRFKDLSELVLICDTPDIYDKLLKL